MARQGPGYALAYGLFSTSLLCEVCNMLSTFAFMAKCQHAGYDTQLSNLALIILLAFLQLHECCLG